MHGGSLEVLPRRLWKWRVRCRRLLGGSGVRVEWCDVWWCRRNRQEQWPFGVSGPTLAGLIIKSRD